MKKAKLYSVIAAVMLLGLAVVPQMAGVSHKSFIFPPLPPNKMNS